MSATLNDMDPVVEFVLWGYDLRGKWTTEFAAAVAEGQVVDSGLMWDHPEYLDGWYRDGQPYLPPPVRALPWASGPPPTRCMFRPQSQWDAELAR